MVTARLSPCGSILGRVMDGAGSRSRAPNSLGCTTMRQGIPHIAFPDGRWIPTDDEIRRDKRTSPFPVMSLSVDANISETSGEDGRFRIQEVIPGATCRLQIILDQARLRLGLKAPQNRGEKLLLEIALTAGQVRDLGDVQILPEELHGDR